MLRHFLLSALAATTLAGCATDYAYRDGNGGDYYYGQPRTEYRYYGAYGALGYGYDRYAPAYYYDRYGRLVYGNPYGYQYYGYPYGQGSWWYRQRPRHGHDADHDHDADRHDRKPPWRDIGRLVPPTPGMTGDDGEEVRPRVRRQAATPFARPESMPERSVAPVAPRMRSDDSGSSRLGRVIRNAKASDPADEE